MYKILKKIIPDYFKKIIIKEVDKNYLFSGWGMKSRGCPPWKYVHNLNDNSIKSCHFICWRYLRKSSIIKRQIRSLNEMSVFNLTCNSLECFLNDKPTAG